MAFSLFGSAFTDNVTVVTAAFLNHVRTSINQAIDGTRGGTYVPSSPVVINGSGLASDNIGTSTVTGDLTVNGAMDCDTTLVASGAVDFGSTLDVIGAVGLDDDLTVAGDTLLAGTLAVNGEATLRDHVIISGNSAGIRYRVDTTTVGNADATLDVTADVYIASAIPTVARTLTLDHTTQVPAEGQVIRICCTQTGGVSYWAIEREDGTELARLGTDNRGFVDCIYDGTAWYACAAGDAGTITSHT